MIITYFLTFKYQFIFTYETMPSNFLVFFHVGLKEIELQKNWVNKYHYLDAATTINFRKTVDI